MIIPDSNHVLNNPTLLDVNIPNPKNPHHTDDRLEIMIYDDLELYGEGIILYTDDNQYQVYTPSQIHACVKLAVMHKMKMIADFMQMPFELVPLYINDPDLAEAAKARLKMAK